MRVDLFLDGVRVIDLPKDALDLRGSVLLCKGLVPFTTVTVTVSIASLIVTALVIVMIASIKLGALKLERQEREIRRRLRSFKNEYTNTCVVAVFIVTVCWPCGC